MKLPTHAPYSRQERASIASRGSRSQSMHSAAEEELRLYQIPTEQLSSRRGSREESEPAGGAPAHAAATKKAHRESSEQDMSLGAAKQAAAPRQSVGRGASVPKQSAKNDDSRQADW